MALPDGFLVRINNTDLSVARSVFRNVHGYWAKDWPEVVDVYVQFDDGATYTLEPADFRALTRVQQAKVRNAPSSPLP